MENLLYVAFFWQNFRMYAPRVQNIDHNMDLQTNELQAFQNCFKFKSFSISDNQRSRWWC